ncbi:nucleotide-diphospho-sugar transferase [Melampsora americana]|nr:nucleotide-diphospho-sugar transferase [Melampsora americana]
MLSSKTNRPSQRSRPSSSRSHSSQTIPTISLRHRHSSLRPRRVYTAVIFVCACFIVIISATFYVLKTNRAYRSYHALLHLRSNWRNSRSPDGRSSFDKGGLQHDFRTEAGLRYPPDVYPALMNPYRRANATFVALVRSLEREPMMQSMRSIEDRVNRKFGYPWVFLSEEEFTEDFKAGVKSMTRSPVYFGLIPKEHWGYPSFIDQERANRTRTQMGKDGIVYGQSESYRHMCRYQSGFFFRHPLMLNFNYYWRVEPAIELFCDHDYDPFVFMEANRKIYSFVLSLYEYRATLPTLWNVTREFVKSNPSSLAPDNSLGFLVDQLEKGMDAEYNLCHFWSNFEIGDLRFWRSQTYLDFFNHLDRQGGFYYERWGDAPIHSIAASLFLSTYQIHQWDDIAYYHPPFTHCPTNLQKYHISGKCYCDPKDNFDKVPYSCTPRWWKVSG